MKISRGSNKGFSLIELCIVLVIIGLLIGPLFTFLDLYLKEKAWRITHENLASISLALGQYYGTFGHYPCPARLDAQNQDKDFGEETECKVGDDKKSGGSTSTNYLRPGTGCSGGVCDATGYGGDKIKIGALPNRALGIPFQKVIDGYGNRITYAVTERYATATPKRHLGVISINNSKGKSLINTEPHTQ